MADKHTFQELRKPYVFQPYPKIKYRAAPKGQGDLKSPAYEKIVVSEQGQAQRVPERHPYATCTVGVTGPDGSIDLEASEAQEARLGPEWFDHPDKIKVVRLSKLPKRGRPKKLPEVE